MDLVIIWIRVLGWVVLRLVRCDVFRFWLGYLVGLVVVGGRMGSASYWLVLGVVHGVVATGSFVFWVLIMFAVSVL